MIVLVHSRLGEKLVKIFYVFAFQHHLDQKVIFFNQEIAAKASLLRQVVPCCSKLERSSLADTLIVFPDLTVAGRVVSLFFNVTFRR